MPTLILADIHGNLPALEAVLATPKAQACTHIISLGDHVNFGPQSREVHQRLTSLGATLLLGNHEERLLHPHDAGFDGYNWALLRWTAQQMQGVSLHLPTDVRQGDVLFTHGTPGQPYHLVYPEDLPAVLSGLPDGVSLLVSGHNHHRWDVSAGSKRAFNPGSVGMAEDGCGSVAPFAVLDRLTITRHEVPYNVQDTLRAFVATGACRVAPELCRMVAHVMQTACYQGVLQLMRHVSALGNVADPAVWAEADRTWPWTEPISSTQYWQKIERSL